MVYLLASLPEGFGKCITGKCKNKPGNSMICLRKVKLLLLWNKSRVYFLNVKVLICIQVASMYILVNSLTI
ncbi:hypothetical protein PTKIN_Ptkin07bG0029300 [Pterospermum kingtungense]